MNSATAERWVESSAPTTDLASETDLTVVLPNGETAIDSPDEGTTQERSESVFGATESSEITLASGAERAFSELSPQAVPPMPEPPYRFDLRQQWEGTVVAVGDDEFQATLRDLTAPGGSMEEATFSIEEVSPGDMALLVPGAVFRWSIGYKKEEGRTERVSRLHFARLPGWSKRAIERIEEEAADLQRLFSEQSASP